MSGFECIDKPDEHAVGSSTFFFFRDYFEQLAEFLFALLYSKVRACLGETVEIVVKLDVKVKALASIQEKHEYIFGVMVKLDVKDVCKLMSDSLSINVLIVAASKTFLD